MEKKFIILMFFAVFYANTFSNNSLCFEGIPPNEVNTDEDIVICKLAFTQNFDKEMIPLYNEEAYVKPPVFDIGIKFNEGIRFIFDVYPNSTTSLNKYANNRGVIGVGAKIDFFIGDIAKGYNGSNAFIGVGIGLKVQSNYVDFTVETKSITSLTFPVYTTMRYAYRINDVFNPYVKGNIGLAFSHQSGENYSKNKLGFYAGAYLGVDIGRFSLETGIERTGVSKSFSVGIGYILSK